MLHFLTAALQILAIRGFQVTPVPWSPEPPSAAEESKAYEDVIAEFGGVEELCQYWYWRPRPADQARPRIFYGMVAGNEGQQDVYETHFFEIYPFVHRIIALDPDMTHLGHPRNLSFDMTEARFARFDPKLRHVVQKDPLPGVISADPPSPQEVAAFMRPGHETPPGFFLREKWLRSRIGAALQNPEGEWEMRKDDIVLIADSDEIPLRESLVALLECENPVFAGVRSKLDAGNDPTTVCAKDAKILLQSQVFEYFMDCPTTQPVWWHPDAILAACVMNGGVDTEDVRTGSEGRMTSATAARHIHNFGMSNDDVVFKYSHYVEPRSKGLDSGLDSVTHDEMRWRVCDPAAPDIGPEHWYMSMRPSNDFVSTGNKRGFSNPDKSRRGVERPFALMREKPSLAAKFYWKDNAERTNPFVGKTGGNHYFTH